MVDLIESWIDGLGYLIADDLISFYTFFTVILAECSYLWGFHEVSIAIPFTIILLGYMINVIVFAFLKGRSEGTKLEKLFSILYVIVFVMLFIIGCIFNWCICIITTVIPLAITALWIAIRNIQDTFIRIPKISPKSDHLISVFNKFFYVTSQIIIIGGPFVIFTIFFAKLTFIPILLKVIIPALYLVICPFIAYFEDASATCNVFGLAYNVTWSKELEEYHKKLEENINSQKK